MKLFGSSLLRQIRNQKGNTLITSLVAAGIIAASIGGVAVSSLRLHKAMKKSEIANMAVVVESNLISAFHSKTNFPDPSGGGPGATLNATLRSGQLPASFQLDLGAPIGAMTLQGGTVPSALSGVTFLTKGLNPCAGYSNDCVLRVEVRLGKVPGSASSFAFSYQVDANPEVITMAALGDITSFSSPIDPGLYRAEYQLTKCDPAEDLFMTGMNRDTGEVFCVEKPPVNSCPDGKIPKGLEYIKYNGQDKAGTIKLKCTSNSMRTFSCPPNYALQSFDARTADPDYGSSVSGTCVFRTKHDVVLPSTLPANPTSPYRRSISGTVCPPYYKASNLGACQLVPDTSRNSSLSYGLGKCATTAYKDCKRDTWTDSTTSDGGAAFNAWNTCQSQTPPPSGGCGPKPANPVYTTTRTCSFQETSTYCTGTPNVATNCATKAPDWTSGTPYASGVTTVHPTAAVVVSYTGRGISCSFQDTSPLCSAPATDASGNTYGKKNPKWYGGVKVSGVTCIYDPNYGAETVPAF